MIAAARTFSNLQGDTNSWRLNRLPFNGVGLANMRAGYVVKASGDGVAGALPSDDAAVRAIIVELPDSAFDQTVVVAEAGAFNNNQIKYADGSWPLRPLARKSLRDHHIILRNTVDTTMAQTPSVFAFYTLAGPSGGEMGVASAPFTVALVGVDATVVTPHDGGAGGTFAPASVTLTPAAPSKTFTYTPMSAGTKTISVTNSGGLADPAPLSYVATSPPVIEVQNLEGVGGGMSALDGSASDTGTQLLTTLGGKLHHALMYAQLTGAPLGDIVCRIWDGPYGNTIATSDPIAAASVPAVLTELTFNFSGANQITLAAATGYAITVGKTTAGGNNSGVSCPYNSRASYPYGAWVRAWDGSWTQYGTLTEAFKLYVTR